MLCYVECTQFLRRWKHKINKLKKETQVEEAGDSMAAMAKIVASQLNENNTERLKRPALSNEPSTSQLEQVTTLAKRKLFNEDSSSSDSEDDYKLEDRERNILVDEKFAMLNKFAFLKKPKILKDSDLEFYKHFRYIYDKYVSKQSSRQINIRAALYKRYNKVTVEDCDFDKLDLKSMKTTEFLSRGLEYTNSNKMDGNRKNTNTDANTNVNEADRSSVVYSQNKTIDVTASPSPQMTVLESNTVTQNQVPQDELQMAAIATQSSENNEIGSETNINEIENENGSSGDLKGGAVITLELQKQGSANMETKSVYSNAPQTPSRSRRASKHLIGVPKVLKLIDDTRKELWKLMQDSFVRFRSTQQYIEYLQNLDRNKSISHKN